MKPELKIGTVHDMANHMWRMLAEQGRDQEILDNLLERIAARENVLSDSQKVGFLVEHAWKLGFSTALLAQQEGVFHELGRS